MSRAVYICSIRVIGLLLVFVWLTFNCQSPNESVQSAQEGELDLQPIDFDYTEIKKRGTLRVVVDNSTTSYFIYKGRAMGYEYELLKRFADHENLRLEVIINNNLQEAFELINSGKADLIAYHLAITSERKKRFLFSEPHSTTRQVLVQAKPENWREMKLHEIENGLIRNPLGLAGKQVHVREESSFVQRLENLQTEIGDSINVIEVAGNVDTEMLIRQVNDGELPYTMADEDVAMINATYYPRIDVKTPLSFSQKIAWGMRKNAQNLKTAVDKWLTEIKRKPDFKVIYNRYYKNKRNQLQRVKSEFSSITRKSISPYDELIQSAAEKVDIDWRLLTALVYQESRFDPKSESWMGAKGLMQITDKVADEYDVQNVFNPEENILAGVQHLQWLDIYWEDKVLDEEERLKFVIGSYNVGHGHVQDARRLAEKYGADSELWDDNVAKYLLLKSTKAYYSDPVVTYGYCRGQEPVKYVSSIMSRFEQYRTFFSSNDSEESTP